MKQRIGYWIAAVVLGVAELFFAVMTVLSVLPPSNALSVEVRETVAVSSSALDAEKTQYVSQLSGVLIYTGDKNLSVDALRITVGNGAETKEIVLEDVLLPSRLEREIFYEWTDTGIYDRVLKIEAEVGKRTEPISNRTAKLSFDAGVLLWLALAVVIGLFLVHVIKQHYYLAQEAAMREQKKENVAQ